jgi:iron complex outermembrane receptor protein
MNVRYRLMLIRRQILIGFMLLFCLTNRAIGQNYPPTAQGTDSKTAAGDQQGVDAGSIDKLLDLAEKDVGQLSQVKVAGNTGSPSLDQPVSTVARQESTVGKSPAAVFVITNEMIRRSGAQNIPDVLRMVPGLDVARIDSSKWAVSSRGFNSNYSHLLLVQIDGRTIYDLTYSGVLWDVQDLILDDVERIEVIRGPGATIWGANAVNGVINIITKKAQDTQGVLLQGGAGTMELGFTNARAGGRIGEDMYYRVYGRWFERGQTYSITGEPQGDDWRQARGGFRMDYDASRSDKMTLQGDYYNGYSYDIESYATLTPPYMEPIGNTHVAGENIIYRWKHTFDEDSDWCLESYYDRTERHQTDVGFAVDRDLYVLDFQHRFPLGARNEIIWGCGYWYTQSHIENAFYQSFFPPGRTDHYYNFFLQDQITLVEDRWFLIGGSKFEYNPYTNFEYQPTVRLLWTPDNRHSIWGAVSRAVHVPDEFCANVKIKPNLYTPYPVPGFLELTGNTSFKSEELLAWELGIRTQATERFSWDLALFFNQYTNLLSFSGGAPFPVPSPPLPPVYTILPLNFVNAGWGETYGIELSTIYSVNERWRLQCAYTYLRMFLYTNPDLSPGYYPGDSPINQVYLQSSWDFGDHWQFDWIGRYVDNLDSEWYGSRPNYITMDVRLAWHNKKNLELAVVGRDLLGFHSEFDPNDLTPPQVYGQITWRY